MLVFLYDGRSVVGAMVVSLGGVAMIAQPSFLFGGKGINKMGLGLAIMQVCLSSSLTLLPFLSFLPLLPSLLPFLSLLSSIFFWFELVAV